MDLIVPILVIFVLILLNGIFVAAEFAIIGVRPTRIKQLAEDGNQIAKRLDTILRNPAKVDRYIATAQLGITLASLGLGMYGEPVIAHFIEAPLHNLLGDELVHTISFLTGLTIITYFHVVIGEMVPKSLALQNAERTVFLLAAPMILMQSIFSIPITILNKIGLWVLRVMRVPPPARDSRLHDPEELELIISESVVGGLIQADEQELISNIFDFGEIKVREIMIPRPKIDSIPITISEENLLKKVVDSPHNRFPIYEDTMDNIIGIVHLKDIVHQQLEKTTFDLKELLHEVPFVPEQTSAETLLTLFKKEHVHMAVVVDEYGGTAGIVTLEDLIEEIVGEVRDEFDEEETNPILHEGNVYTVDGLVSLNEAIERFGDPGGEPQSTTIGGYVAEMLNRIPAARDKIPFGEYDLRVEEMDGMRVSKVRFVKRQSPKPAPQTDSASTRSESSTGKAESAG